ncbi:MAG: histidinol dehydrogenase [Puniceicoccales bacterium]|jgi:histidinol dehydrogenase|nr:histidinol dehydrogenase [Puniceicoccales bacterium]
MTHIEHRQKDFRQRLDKICATSALPPPEVSRAVAEIIAAVREQGDAAVLHYTALHDHARLSSKQMRVPPATLDKAVAALPADFRKALDEARANVRDYYAGTVPKSWERRNSHGARVGEVFHPIRRCGLYIPGGQAPLVSTVLMTAVPAALAGVPQIVACTPPRPDGLPAAPVLAALRLCGVEEVYAIGGAQAIAALAIGTESIAGVDKVFGPGNAYVCEAKRQVFGEAGVDLLPGPSEVMVISDGSTPAEWAAASILAQAEHGTGRERTFLIAPPEFIREVLKAVEIQLVPLPRKEQIRRALDLLVTIVTAGAAQTIEIANRIAPEHLELHTAPEAAAEFAAKIVTAGAIFIGPHSPTVLGDFVAGPSHTLPTARTGRFLSGLQVGDFMRRTSIVEYTPDALRKAASAVEAFAKMEQLEAHGRSLTIRLETE